jgi:putative redox protein
MSLVKTAVATWDSNMCFDTVSGSGHAARMDGDGNVTGFSPMELLLVALAGCTGMDVVSILKKKRQEVTAMQVNARGVQADEHPKVFTAIDLEFVVRGHGVDPVAVDRAIYLSQNKYCPVSATLGGPAVVHCTYRIEEAEPA